MRRVVRKWHILPASRTLLFHVVTSFIFSLNLSAQVERATITGVLTDAGGANIPGATIRIRDEATNQEISLQSDAAGSYTVGHLTPGSYAISVEKEGFSKHVNRGFVVQVGQTARLDIVMEVGSVSQTVEVTTAAPVLQSENAAVGQVISSTAVAQLPLNGRNLAQLAVITPGVTGLNYAPVNTINAGARPDELRPGGTTIEANGARNSANKLLLDGIDNTEMIAQTQIVRPSIEGLQEFNVITANAGPEYNRGGGAIVVTSTRSGTNRFHGSIYEYLRNSAVDAKNYFVLPGSRNPRYQLNDLGGRLGGPIWRDKMFFFLNYEGYYERAALTQVNTVPTLAMRSGNFQGVAHVYDPTTTVQSGSTYRRQQFANDIIPASRFDPIAAQLVAAYPLPTRPGLVNNIVTYPLKRSNDNRGDTRFDYQISPKQTFFARYSVNDTQIQMPNTFNDVIGGNENSFSGPQSTRGQHGAASYSRILSPNLVGEYRIGFTRFSSFLLPSPLTSPIWSQIPGRLALPGYQPSGTGDGPVAPIISPSGYGGLGNSRGEPQVRREHMLENIGMITWQHGKHDLKFGLDILNRLISETVTPPGQSPFGRFNFDGNFTNNPASTGGTGNAIASMLLGYPSTTARDFFLPGTAWVYANEYNVFAGDNWRVSPKLTLNLGLHYEVNTPFAERQNHWVNFDRVSAKVVIAGQDGASKYANWNTSYSAIGPRIGFAYTADAKTVIRGGYGIFYDPQANQGTTLRQQRQWPFDLVYSTAPGTLFPANTVSQGFLTPAQIPPGVFASPFGTLKGIDPNFKNGQIQQFNLTVQRQLSSLSSFSVGYVGSVTHNLTWNQPIDQPTPGPGNIQARRPYNAQFPNVTAIAFYQSVGYASYNSLQLTFQQRMSHGLFLTTNYVIAHALDNAPYDGGANGPIPQDPLNRAADYGNSDNDIRSRLNLYGSYQLPFGQGRAFLNSNSFASKYLLGGWQLNGILVAQSSLPFTVTINGTATNTGASSSRADIVPGAPRYPDEKTITQWFNPAAFRSPVAYNYGNVARNSMRGPRTTNVDTSLEKRTPLGGERELLFRVEFFNVFNHPQFVIPASTINASGAGTITATSNTARQLQGALRFSF
jgi:hypothetical protein